MSENTIFDTYRNLSEANLRLGDEPNNDFHRVAQHVSKLANEHGDKHLHALAHQMHDHIAASHESGWYNGSHWADIKTAKKHAKIAAEHAKKAK